MSSRFMRRSTAVSVMSERGLWSRVLGKTMSVSASLVSFKDSSSCIAASDSGTRCSFPAFMRSPGTVHSLCSKSTSYQAIPRTSPERAAVRMVNCRASAPMPLCWRSSAMKGFMSRHGSAAKCFDLATLERAGSSASRWPFQRAGLSPVRYRCTVAQSSTASKRPRRREAVSALVCHTGSSTRMMCAVSISATSILPMMGAA